VGRKLQSYPTAKILMLLLGNLFWSRMLRFQTQNSNTVPEGGTASAWWQWHSQYPKRRTCLFDWLTPPHNEKRPKKMNPPKCQINATISESKKQRHYTAPKKHTHTYTKFKSMSGLSVRNIHNHLWCPPCNSKVKMSLQTNKRKQGFILSHS
jgi:hypothetical protein